MLVSSAETRRAFNSGFDNVNLHRPTQSTAGTLVSWFASRFNSVSAVSPPSAAGTLVSSFLARYNQFSAVSPPM